MNIPRGKSIFLIYIFAAASFLGAQTPAVNDNSVAKVGTSAIETKVAVDELVKKPEPAKPVPPDLSRVGVQTANAVPITLEDAIRRALLNNNSIELTRDDVRFQETQIRSVLGTYDPVFFVSPTYTRNSTTGNPATNDFNVNGRIDQFLPTGGNYSAFFNNSRTENAFAQAQVSSGSISDGSSAIFSSSLGVRYTQPLFRNLKIDNTRRSLRIARRRLEQTDADFRRQAIETIVQVQRAYWDLVFALRDQQNRVANLNLSQENRRNVEARIAAGASAPLARAEVETELANREIDVLLATQLVSVAENSLKQLLLKDAVAPEWAQSWLPTDKPAISPLAIKLDEAVKDAMDNRFELRRLKFAQDINNIDIDYFRNQVKPQIDLNTTFSLDGLSRGGASTDSVTFPLIASDPVSIQSNAASYLLSQIRRFHGGLPLDGDIPNVTVPGSPSFLVGGFGRSMVNMFRSDAPNYSVGVTISFPFRNRTAKANLAGAEIQKNQIETQLRAQEQVVIVEVRNAVQAVETSMQRVLASRRARENAEVQLEGERRLFDAGRSTTFLLFQRENTLTNARNAEIRAETDYSKALADLHRATSTTFRVNNIVVDSPTN